MSRCTLAGEAPAEKLRAVLLSAEQASAERIAALKSERAGAVVLELRGTSMADKERVALAARRVRNADLGLYYWIEIGRNPALADAHPEWMASLQGHQEWRRFFRDVPHPKEDEVVKNYPWVPILYKEAFNAHLSRVERLLHELPIAKGIFLNDLQGGPSACGCGNLLCRWTADYGPIRTATPLGNDAAARFVRAVRKLAPDSRIIPVWTTECEKHDGATDGLCAGVGCYRGICWKAYTAQLMPLAREAERIAVLLPFREFQRNLPIYGSTAGWVSHALKSFATMPPRHGGKAVPARRMIAVLQGWGVSEQQVAAQIDQANEAGAAGYVVSMVKIEQGWQPRIVKRK